MTFLVWDNLLKTLHLKPKPKNHEIILQTRSGNYCPNNSIRL